MKKKSTNTSYGNKAFRIMIAGTIIMILATICTVVLFSYVMNKLNYIETEAITEFDGHYVFIADHEEDFWQQVYAKANEQAAQDNVYVEYLEKSLGVNYTNYDLFRVAINSSVDGIIYGGTPDLQISKLINKAVNDGIGVVILQNDAENTTRQCFVGVNNYELGQVYAGQIAEMFSGQNYGEKKVKIVINSNVPEGVGNLFIIAMEDFFVEKYPEQGVPEIELVRIDMQDVFSVEEDVRNIILQEELPDAMICLNSTFTQCMFQALVDLNKVGETQLVGYYVNDNIIDAIDKQVIYSTVSIDTEQLGKSSVLALEEYCNYGYTNSYVPVSVSVIGKKEARGMIDDKE
ncbi:MAG: substrate-binding domain-containing protein [Lachnospiraceae bacterium]|nr:substrate-binding domain-containing protein [Candidatus Colinaster scatohippi]